MDDEIIYSWCFHDVECFDSTPSATIIILDKDLESFLSLISQQRTHKSLSLMKEGGAHLFTTKNFLSSRERESERGGGRKVVLLSSSP